jgi:hypothetical protein
MPAKLIAFDKMWDAYPNPGEGAEAAKHTIGGAAESETITNTCVLRVSRCFNYSGNDIPKSSTDEILTIRGGDGKQYALRVREFSRYLYRKYGAPDLEHEYPDGNGGDIPPEFLGQQGVIGFEVDGWTDATGHFDLWNGTKCRHHGYFNRAKKVMLWLVPDTPRYVLTASVGRRGKNRPADVEIVQNLLADAGFDPGPIDGECGKKTIAAILEFQKRYLAAPDGRIDVDGRSWNELLRLS